MDEIRYVRRVGLTNTRVTQGRVYRMIDGKIKDDNDNYMTPYLSTKVYWEDVTNYCFHIVCDEKFKARAKISYCSGTCNYNKDEIYVFEFDETAQIYAEENYCLRRFSKEQFDKIFHIIDVDDANLIDGDKEMASVKPGLVKIEEVILINGNRADEMDEDVLIGLIESEQQLLARIDELNLKKSKAIKKIAYRHEQATKKIVEVLDSRYLEDDDE